MQQAREDRRAALSTWLLANINRDTEHRAAPFEFQEVVGWLGHHFTREAVEASPPSTEPPTAEELLERAKLLNQMYGGTTANGTG